MNQINYGDQNQYALKIDDFLTMAEWQFEMEDSTQAEIYINRVKHLIHNVENDQMLQLRYKQANIRIADAKREFVTAAQGYYNFSNEEGLDQDEVFANFLKAVVCGILAKSGPRKQRILAILLKDERSKMNPFADLLTKMALQRVIRPSDVGEFEKQLETHQKVELPDGYTVLEKALIEHNISCLSSIYMNITFVELGNFLRIKPDKAEGVIAKMIAEKRICGVLDQVN